MRRATALLLVVVAAVHLNLYQREEYRRIPTVGWLFLSTVVAAAVLAVVLTVRPRPVVDVAAGLFAVGVLGGYLLTLLLPQGLFDFKEPGISYSGGVSIAAEVVVLLLSALAAGRHRHQLRGTPR